jgi:hypothetical protein
LDPPVEFLSEEELVLKFRNEIFDDRHSGGERAARCTALYLVILLGPDPGRSLPGPASSQVGISIGTLRAGLPGAVCAWLGFTIPSALAIILFGYGVTTFGNLVDSPWLHGLKIVAVAVVAQVVCRLFEE